MRTSLSEIVDVDVPLVAFSHCRDVVAEVSKAGGCGVLGVALLSPDELEQDLAWIDRQVGGRPYGVDLAIPARYEGIGDPSTTMPDGVEIDADVRSFVASLLREHRIDGDPPPVTMASAETLSAVHGERLVDIALRHPISLIANALGPPPPAMVDAAHTAGVPIGGLAGTPLHAVRQVAAGVDFVVAQGVEAGGHTGEISTLVLVPEVIQALQDHGTSLPVLAAGGIVTGRQLAAVVALGAAGAWTGSAWLTTHEAETTPHLKGKLLRASSSDTVRSVHRTGKPSRQLRSPWHDAWERPGSPAALPMPLMGYVSEPALRWVAELAERGHEGARELNTYWVGQGVGLMRSTKAAREVVADFIDDYLNATARLSATVDDV